MAAFGWDETSEPLVRHVRCRVVTPQKGWVTRSPMVHTLDIFSPSNAII